MFCLPRSQNSKIALLLICAVALSAVVSTAAFAQSKEATPGWRQKLGTFRVGIVGGNRTLLKTRRAQPFREALQRALGMPVEIFAARDFAALIEAHTGSRIEYAVYSATAFSLAWSKCKCVEPLVLPKALDGSSGFKSILLTNGKMAASLDAAKQQSVLVPGKNSFSGYAVPTHHLAEIGTSLEAAGWNLNFKNNMEGAVEAFIEGQAASVFGWAPAMYAEEKNPENSPSRGTQSQIADQTEELKVVWSSPPIPHGPHTVRKSLSAEAKSLLRDFLTNLSEKSPGAYGAIEANLAGGFALTTLEAYRPVIDMVQQGPPTKDARSQLRGSVELASN